MPLSSALVLSLCVASVWSATYTWTGLIGNGIWSEPRNWNPSTAVPGPNDVAFVNPGTNAQIQVDSPAQVDELHIASGQVYVPNALTATTTLVLSAAGSMRFDCGSQLISTSYGNISAGAGIQFSSGTLSGNWDIRESSLLNFTGAGQKAFSQAKVTASGVTTCNAGATFNLMNASTVNFAKGLALTAPLSQPAVFLGSDDSSVSGSINLNANSRVNIQVPTSFTDIQLGSSSYMAVITSKHTMGSIVATTDSTIDFMGGTSASISTLSSAGTFKSSGAVTVANPATLSKITITGDVTTFSKDAKADSVTMLSGTLSSTGFTCDTFTVSQVGTIGGSGQFAVDTFTSGTQQTIIAGPSVSVAKTATLHNAVLISGGMLNISSSATATASGMSMGVSGSRPATTMFLVDGALTVDASSKTSFNQVNGAGAGKLTLDAGAQMTFESSTWSCDTAALGSGAEISGQNTKWNFGAITADTDITLNIDSVTVDCGKACGKIDSDTPELSFSVKAA
eukprot:NODE_702_length_1697_cov_99.983439_g692_i0.p2 GENE.NODE_702_length_1697_cov_99.983439_g692_i0~~NODE_702_length_1697_cov_99.983439_g692_i0.p2  ORF type:complete len:510 (+),score=123.32 NODE_702_length_1697_cov_99.983439_g692_i0:64-1593(+)